MRSVLVSGLLLFGVPLLAQAQHPAAGPAIGGATVHVGAVAAAPIHGAPVPSAAVGHPTGSHALVAHPATPGTRPPALIHRTWQPGAPMVPVRSHPIRTGPVGVVNRVPADSFTDFFPAPGLGFDYPHFFATHPNFARHHRTDGFVLPFFGGGIYVPFPFYAEPPTQEEQAAEENTGNKQDSTATESADLGSPAPVSPVSSSSPQSPGEYVFVRRDGSVFFAVAYSWIGQNLQYISKEGLRRTVSRDKLDLDATQQFNQQRGISITLPA